jgi:hypothetical protein
VEASPELATEVAGQRFYVWRDEFTFQLTFSF